MAALTVGVLAWLAPVIQDEIRSYLEQKTGRSVELGSLSWSIWSGPRLSGEGLRVAKLADTDPRPLLSVESFDIQVRPWALLSKPRRIHALELQGVRLFIPPRQKDKVSQEAPSALGALQLPISLDRIVAEDVRVEIAAVDPRKDPRILEIQRLLLNSVALDNPISFEALLTYPKPRGQLEVAGSFGPWNNSSPIETAISGCFQFNEADLSVFRGISGLLTASGTFEGNLQETGITGEADIPDFSLTRVGTIVPLHSLFEARRRGTDVLLRSVQTAFRESVLLTKGEITRDPAGEGRIVNLDVESERARAEDVLQFAIKSEKSPLMGDMDLDSVVHIPPGSGPFMDRFRIQGQFNIREGYFTSTDVRKTLEKISQIGGGESEGEAGSSAVSDLEGSFVVEHSVVDFSSLTFSVPGTAVDLRGSYGLRDETLDFRGNVLLSRSPSQMTSGQWSQWLKVLDPLLRREKAGTAVPIKISGTRSKPSFSLDLGGFTRR
jgi:hypothetical protein